MFDPFVINDANPRLRTWLDAAATLAESFDQRAAEHDRDASFPFENFTALHDAEFHLLTVPGEYGGWGATLPEAVRVVEALAYGDGPTTLVFDMHVHILGSLGEGRSWDEPRFASFCREIVRDGAWVNSCATEPELGSPSRGGLPRTRAVRTDDGWRITGRKSFTSGAPILTHMLVPAVLEDDEGETVGVFVVRRDRPGLRIDPTWDVMGMRTTASHDLVLDDVPVSPDDLVQRRAAGAADPGRFSGPAWFGLTVSGVYLGIAAAARDAAIRFARERRPTALQGAAIATLPAIQQQVGALESELLTARALLYAIADAWHTRPDQRAALLAHVGHCKAVATSHAVKAADLAMRVVGGQSMSRALPLERYFRNVRAGLFHPPTEELAYANLGKSLLDV